jgi:hypothetical protein
MFAIKSEEHSQLALALRSLLDLAVKSGGMQVAEIAVGIDQMIVQAGRNWEVEKLLAAKSKTG